MTRRSLVAPLVALALSTGCLDADHRVGSSASAITLAAPSKVVAAEQATSGWFGFSVALGPTMALVGGHGGEAAYLLQPSPAGWVEAQKLEYGSPPPNNDQYGRAVALRGTTAFVSGPDRWWGALDTTGWVQVLELSGGALAPKQTVRPDFAETWGSFGDALAADGDTLLVGAPTTESNWTGAAFVFVRSSAGVWVEQAKLVAGAPGAAAELGRAVALQGDRAVIGAPGHTHQGVKTGAAYVFERTGTTWTEKQLLVGGDSALGHRFGGAVAIDGETIVVGASHAEAPASGGYLASEAGAAYVFTRSSAGAWTEQTKLIDLYPDFSDRCGRSLALDGDRLAVGCYTDSYWGPGSGIVLGFVRTPSGWSTPDRIVAFDGQGYDNFGWSLALEGDQLLIGADGVGGNVNVSPGAVYFFDASKLSGGGDAGVGGGDASTADASTDASTADAGAVDSAPTQLDAGPDDTGPDDGGTDDAGTDDAGPGDAGPGDAGPGDAGPDDAGPDDAGPDDAGPDDAGTGDHRLGGAVDGNIDTAAGCDCRTGSHGGSVGWIMVIALLLGGHHRRWGALGALVRGWSRT